MKFLIILKATADSEAGKMPPPEVIDAVVKFDEEVVNAGILLAGENLFPSSMGKRLTNNNGHVTVTNGPFPNPTEQIAGYWVWELENIEEAEKWARKLPFDGVNGTTIEIRPIASLADLQGAFSPEIVAKLTELRERVEGK